jgi:hypothetical protein
MTEPVVTFDQLLTEDFKKGHYHNVAFFFDKTLDESPEPSEIEDFLAEDDDSAELIWELDEENKWAVIYYLADTGRMNCVWDFLERNGIKITKAFCNRGYKKSGYDLTQSKGGFLHYPCQRI